MPRVRTVVAMAQPLAYNVAEVALLLGLSEWTVRRQIAAGQIPSIRYRTRLLIPRCKLEESLRGASLVDVVLPS